MGPHSRLVFTWLVFLNRHDAARLGTEESSADLLASASPLTNLLRARRTEVRPALRVVHINDVYTLETMPKLKKLVDLARSSAEKTIVTVGGDFLSPYLLASFDKGAGMVKMLGNLGVDYVIFGNHECDVGDEELKHRIKELTDSGAKWINTNMPTYFEDSGIGDMGVKATSMPRSVNIDIGPGGEKKVMLFSALTNEVTSFSGSGKAFSGAAGRIQNPVDAAREMLGSTEADFVIPLTHLYLQKPEDLVRAPDFVSDRKFAMELLKMEHHDKVVALLGGHDHPASGMQVFLDAGGREAAPGPGTLQLLKGAIDAKHAAMLDISLVSGKASIVAWLESVADWPEEDSSFREQAIAANKALLPIESMVLSAEHVRDMFGGKIDFPLDSRHVREKPSNMASFMAGMSTRGLKCDFSLIHGGGVRGQQLVSGGISVKHIIQEFPFANNMKCLPVPAYKVQEAIQETRSKGFTASYYHSDPGVVINRSDDGHWGLSTITRYSSENDSWYEQPFKLQDDGSEAVQRFMEAMNQQVVRTTDFVIGGAAKFPGLEVYFVNIVMGVQPENAALKEMIEKIPDWWPQGEDTGILQQVVVFGYIEDWLKSHILKILKESLLRTITHHQQHEVSENTQWKDTDVITADAQFQRVIKTIMTQLDILIAGDKNFKLLHTFDSSTEIGSELKNVNDILVHEILGHEITKEMQADVAGLLRATQAFYAMKKIVYESLEMDEHKPSQEYHTGSSFVSLTDEASHLSEHAGSLVQKHAESLVQGLFHVAITRQQHSGGNLLDHLRHATTAYVSQAVRSGV